MFSFVAVQAGTSAPSSSLNDRVAAVAARVFSWAENLQSTRWTSPSGSSNLWTWSNESTSFGGFVEIPNDRAHVTLGAGKFGPFCTIDSSSVLLIRPLGTMEPIFYAERSGTFIVSNKAVIIALFLAEGTRPELDLAALSAGAANAYCNGCFMNDGTPFAGVNLARPNGEVAWKDGILRIADQNEDFTNFGYGDEDLGDAEYDALSRLFLEGLEPAASSMAEIPIGVTGGQDSRLLAAALKAMDVDFTALTYGFDHNPDVILGERVARFLGVRHKKFPPPTVQQQSGPVFRISPRREIAEALLVSGGMYLTKPNSRYIESKYAETKPQERTPLTISTMGSEIWRGGYSNRRFSWFNQGADETDITAPLVQSAISDIFGRYMHFLRPEQRVLQQEYCRQWLQPRLKRGRPIAAAEQFFLEFEHGRFASAECSSSAETTFFSPFANPEIAKRIGRAKTRYRRDDLVHYNLVKRFAPGLENLPFDTKRWGFEWHGPVDEADRADWLARRPIVDSINLTGGTVGDVYAEWPIYGMTGSECWSFIRDELFGYDNHQNVWAFLDRDAVLKAFTSNEIFMPQMSGLFWVIYGLSILVSGDWLQLDQIPIAPINVRYAKPWGLIYGDLCGQTGKIEFQAREELIAGIVECLDPVSTRPLRSRMLFDLERAAAGKSSVRHAPGERRKLRLETVPAVSGRGWRVSVNADPGSAPKSSYLGLRLGSIQGNGEIAVTLKYRARQPAVARCHLARHGRKTPNRVAGPVIRYATDWQTLEHRFNLREGIHDRGDLKIELLLGLPDDTNQVEFGQIKVEFRPAPAPQSLGRFLSDVEQKTLSRLRAALEMIEEKYELSNSDIEDLLRRANLTPLLNGTGEGDDLSRFEQWLRASAMPAKARGKGAGTVGGWLSRMGLSRRSAAAAGERTAEHISAGIATLHRRWRLPSLCYGLADGVRTSLFESTAMNERYE